MVKIHQQMFQSNSFNGNDLMVLLNWGWSCLINKLSLMRSLNLCVSDARISNDWSLLNGYIQVDDQVLFDDLINYGIF